MYINTEHLRPLILGARESFKPGNLVEPVHHGTWHLLGIGRVHEVRGNKIYVIWDSRQTDRPHGYESHQLKKHVRLR